jgi:GT2 family glycosyltransferase
MNDLGFARANNMESLRRSSRAASLVLLNNDTIVQQAGFEACPMGTGIGLVGP